MKEKSFQNFIKYVQSETRGIDRGKCASIDADIQNVYDSFVSNIRESETVMREKVGRCAACRGVINIFSKEDLKREQEERALRLPNPFKACPLVKYAFYPAMFQPDRLGSVAIYTHDIDALYLSIRLRGVLFGHKVLKINIEEGRSRFLDVQLFP